MDYTTGKEIVIGPGHDYEIDPEGIQHFKGDLQTIEALHEVNDALRGKTSRFTAGIAIGPAHGRMRYYTLKFRPSHCGTAPDGAEPWVVVESEKTQWFYDDDLDNVLYDPSYPEMNKEGNPQWKPQQILIHIQSGTISRLLKQVSPTHWRYETWTKSDKWQENEELKGMDFSIGYVSWPLVRAWVRCKEATHFGKNPYQATKVYESKVTGDTVVYGAAGKESFCRIADLEPASPPVEQARGADISKGDEQCPAIVSLSPHSHSASNCRYVAGHTGKHQTGHDPGTEWETGDQGSGFSRSECLSHRQIEHPKPVTLEGPHWDRLQKVEQWWDSDYKWIPRCALLELRAAMEELQAQVKELQCK